MGGYGAPPMMGMYGMPPQQMYARPGMMGPRPGMPMMGMPGMNPMMQQKGMPPQMMQQQMLGEKLFPLISRFQPELAGKITGMMLEMDNSELLMLLESDSHLKAKVDEALRVLEQMGG